MTTYIGNAFALSMIPDGGTIRVKKVNLPSIAHKLIHPVSIVGHADTARVFSGLLGIDITINRQAITLTEKDTLYVGQLIGGRLPEGATHLPEGFEIVWMCVRVDGKPQPLKRWWAKGGSSVYGAIDRAADAVADLVNGTVEIHQDPWGNPHWEVTGIGFSGSFWDD